MKEAILKVEKWLKGGGKHYIVTPNPEFVMAAQKDYEFKKILNKADLAIADGTRLGWANKMLSERNWFKKILLLPSVLFPTKRLTHFDIVHGVDFMQELIKIAQDQGFTIGFLGGRDGVAAKTSECLKKKYPKLKIVFAEDGPEVDEMGNELTAYDLQLIATDLLFVAFGQRKQEKWIAKNLPKIPVKVAIGVGGAFDYFSGKIPRAPKWMRFLGLEWFFRLIWQPWRIKRQLILLKFVWKITLNSRCPKC
jgi:N-acetylglucosaminyldiphosphoundecaprenol N-acetyl-beta-D-mannosaminyltransferase